MKQFIIKHRRKLIVLTILIAIVLLVVIPNRTTRLINAIEDENVELVREYLEQGIDPNQTDYPPSKWDSFVEFSVRRPLSVACSVGNLEIVQLLIDYGATAEPVEYTGWSPLRSALHSFVPDDVEIVKLLIENGADPTSVEGDYTPIQAAARMYPKRYDPTQGRFVGGYDEDAAKGITEIVALLAAHGSLSERTLDGETLLMFAADRGNLYLVEYLLSKGADKTLKDISKKTAYDYAAYAGHTELLELLNPY